MKVIALTGGIACGKTTLLGTLKAQGAIVIDADRISREMTRDGGMALPAIRQAFGDNVFTADGALDRRRLGDIVFADEEARQRLNAIVHPMVTREIKRQIALYQSGGEKLIFLDIPLLYEANMTHLCDEVWCAYLPKQLQVQRLMLRNRFSEKEALARINSQMPLQQKKRLADEVIDTRGTPEQSAMLITALYQKALKGVSG